MPARSFGCPQCRTMLERLNNETFSWKPFVAWCSAIALIEVGILALTGIYRVGVIEVGNTLTFVTTPVVILLANGLLFAWLSRRFTVTHGPSLRRYPGDSNQPCDAR